MIITCPNCQTRYQLAEKAIGSAGRKVMCANCNQAWKATPDPEPEPRPKPKLVAETKPPAPPSEEDDTLFDPEDEDALDKMFAEEADDTDPKGTGPVDEEGDSADIDAPAKSPAAKKKQKKTKDNIVAETSRQMAMKLRQSELARRLPMGRIRRNARYTALVLLVAMLGGGFYFRTDLVRMVPDLAGIYEAVGLPVNVVGLEFRNMQTLRALSDGDDVMLVTANIRNITSRQVKVPPVVVSILDIDKNVVYQWSALPLARLIGPGEQVEFETRLSTPPAGADTVKLAFSADSAD